MDKKRLQQLRNMAKEAFQSVGTPIDEVALDFASKMADDPRFQQLIDRPDQVAIAAVVAGCLQAATKYTDVPDEQWRGFLDKMKQELLSGLRPKFRKGMNAVAKGLPKKPSTGRKEILASVQKKKKACNLVSKFDKLGYAKSVCYEKAGTEMNCSRRTIQRVWQDRAELYRKV